MAVLKSITMLLAGCTMATVLQAQPIFSLSSDFNLQRSLKKDQDYWAVGQAVTLQYNFSAKDGATVALSYFSNGRFTDPLVAVAKDPLTLPAVIPYENFAKMRFKHFSLGWKHYLVGSATMERGPGIYTHAGLGVLLGLVQNTHSVTLDTATYMVPVLAGKENFKRLTLDLGLGMEYPLGADLYLYGELKTILPLTDYPSPYILDNKYTPYTAMAAIGFRLLFN